MPNNQKTEKIRQRLEQLKKMARPAAEAEEIEMADVPLTESDVTPAAAKPAAAKAEVGDTEEFVLDKAAKFVWIVDGKQLEGQYRLNDATITINDPVTGYTASVPISLPLAITVQGIGRLVDLNVAIPKIPNSLKLRNGTVSVSMAVPLSLPRVAWRVANRSIVWAIIQYMPTKNEWRILRLKSTPRQTVYEAQQIMQALLGESTYNKLKEAVELLATPL
jgi:hypothetical protein